MRLAPVFLSLSVILAGCAGAPPAPGLEGSAWRLARFESPGDNAVVLSADDPQRYTLDFSKDGRLAARLDCNRGTGSWLAAAADAQGGSLRIGPLATTRAMCPPDPIGARLARDLEAVAGYRLLEGRLYMMLPADAGVYVWERRTP